MLKMLSKTLKNPMTIGLLSVWVFRLDILFRMTEMKPIKFKNPKEFGSSLIDELFNTYIISL
jgi:hypothetical protein